MNTSQAGQEAVFLCLNPHPFLPLECDFSSRRTGSCIPLPESCGSPFGYDASYLACFQGGQEAVFLCLGEGVPAVLWMGSTGKSS